MISGTKGIGEPPPRQPVAGRWLRQRKAAYRLRMIPSQRIEQRSGREPLTIVGDETQACAGTQVAKYRSR